MHRSKLDVLVEQRTKELNEVNKKLKQEIEKEKEFEMMLQQSLAKEKELSELKSRFISTTSHEFRTPLTSVLSSAELIHRYGKKWSDEKLAYHTAKIKNSIEYLTNLLDDVLTISRSESGKIVFDPTLINLKSICEELIDESWIQASAEHKINFVFKPQQTKYYLDPKLIRFIIINLLSNAIKYTPNGGLIKFTVEERNGNILLIISDNGIGIPPEEIPRLFEPFSRAQNTIEIPGTGLGLSIVKRAVDLHSGEIKIESDLNKGLSLYSITA
jgi:signal transduction histidine kinase